MMRTPSRTDNEWDTSKVSPFTWEHVAVEVLMDIRQELRNMNCLLNCKNFTEIPTTLRSINRKLGAKKP